ncbi:sulfatase [Carboxylicivirga mesophila]|uniref:Sulfatase n=1 Tax=Carboxylicivirga mesophila TaxID=1166478 RepID=A0ABS5K5M1_9BACT|nr:sulfatase [Carboxylicivirga mesophila]MBS2210274.1 sulfatase [Carboxylicivirga mesophila]
MMNRIIIVLVFVLSLGVTRAQDKPLNILLFTADDLGYEASGTFGRNIPDLTPNLDKFADEGVRFDQAHTNSPICMPSRSIMATGLYGVSSGMMGFMHMKKKVPTTMHTFQDNGYLAGILGKVNHSTPDMQFKWDYVHDYAELGAGRSPSKYAAFSTEFFERCKAEGKPFYFMVNSHDPHRPFYDPEKPMKKGEERPSKLYSPDEVEVPGYLPDIPQVRYELACYYNSIRRLDDTFNAVIDALKEAGLYDNTMIVFLSDNGSAFPFAKANTYVASTKTPFYIHHPGMKAGHVDDEHMVAEVDLFATFLDATGITIKEQTDGKSFMPLVKGKKQKDRNYHFGEIDYKIGGKATPMRSVDNKRFRYIFNPWHMTGYRYSNSNEGEILKTIEKDPEYAEYLEWAKMYRYRVPEELYDVVNDPDGTNNLIDDPNYQKELAELQQALRNWMVEKNDPALTMFDNRQDKKLVNDYMQNEFPTKRSLMPDEQLEEIKRKAELKKKNKAANKKAKKAKH